MARTKRKKNPFHSVSNSDASSRRVYRAGAYVRLSVKDGGKAESESIENQKYLLESYIKNQPDLALGGFYCDNGYTGTDFQRPAFDWLMKDIQEGKIDCVVVRDLSRFGRNYQETGMYLERIFPFLGVRFIAVQDRFDTLFSENAGGSVVPFKNVINEIYSRDISQKTGSALAVKQQNGEFIGSWAAYGYDKCETCPRRLTPNRDTAPVVRDIFQWRLSGMSYGQIARKLNKSGVPSPYRLRYLEGGIQSERYAGVKWSLQTVRQILSNPVYLGSLVQRRQRQSFSERQRRQSLPQSEWIVTENAHEPLVDAAVFEAVQQMSEKRRDSDSAQTPAKTKEP